jgi:hypothetical protein
MIYDVYITVSIYIQTYGERYIQQSPSGKEKTIKLLLYSYIYIIYI